MSSDCVNRTNGRPCDWRDPNAILRETFDAQVAEAQCRYPLDRALEAMTRLLEAEDETHEIHEPRRVVDPMGMTTRDDADRAIDEFNRKDRSQLVKEDPTVNYRYASDPAQSCDTCVNFDGQGSCRIVAGLIRRVDVCDRWE